MQQGRVAPLGPPPFVRVRPLYVEGAVLQLGLDAAHLADRLQHLVLERSAARHGGKLGHVAKAQVGRASDVPSVRLQLADQQAQQRRLAAAVRAYYAYARSAVHLYVDAGEHLEVPVERSEIGAC